MQTTIITPTSNLQQSVDFYKRLNFNIQTYKNVAIATAQNLTIEINSERFIRAGMKIYSKNWGDIINKLKAVTTVLEHPNGWMLNDWNGVRIYLINDELTLSDSETALQPSMLGNFAGVSIETTDLEKSAVIWHILGFAKTMGGIEQGWVVYQNSSGAGVSYMKANSCPHLFFNPSLTFFNGKNNLEIIKQVRATNIPITEEITVFNNEGVVDNIIIRDPGGYGFFLFSD